MQTTLSILTHLIIINLLPTIIMSSYLQNFYMHVNPKNKILNSLCLIMSLILMTTRLSKALILQREI